MKVYIIKVLYELISGTPIQSEMYVHDGFSEASKTFEKIRKKFTKEGYDEFGRRNAIGGEWEQYKTSVPYDGHGVYTFYRLGGTGYCYVVCKTGELTEDPEE